jgi:hypothetical protein
MAKAGISTRDAVDQLLARMLEGWRHRAPQSWEIFPPSSPGVRSVRKSETLKTLDKRRTKPSSDVSDVSDAASPCVRSGTSRSPVARPIARAVISFLFDRRVFPAREARPLRAENRVSRPPGFAGKLCGKTYTCAHRPRPSAAAESGSTRGSCRRGWPHDGGKAIPRAGLRSGQRLSTRTQCHRSGRAPPGGRPHRALGGAASSHPPRRGNGQLRLTAGRGDPCPRGNSAAGAARMTTPGSPNRPAEARHREPDEPGRHRAKSPTFSKRSGAGTDRTALGRALITRCT